MPVLRCWLWAIRPDHIHIRSTRPLLHDRLPRLPANPECGPDHLDKFLSTAERQTPDRNIDDRGMLDPVPGALANPSDRESQHCPEIHDQTASSPRIYWPFRTFRYPASIFRANRTADHAFATHYRRHAPKRRDQTRCQSQFPAGPISRKAWFFQTLDHPL